MVAPPHPTPGPFADPSKARELRDVYRTYLQEHLDREGAVTEQLAQDAKDLQVIGRGGAGACEGDRGGGGQGHVQVIVRWGGEGGGMLR